MSRVSNVPASRTEKSELFAVFKYVSLQNSGGLWVFLMVVLGLGLLCD